ncbi:regulatory-associated protein of mTOR-like isoform X2 [Gordionus sp. m RMFG-2023]
MIGGQLQEQYTKWQPKARYKQCLDPTIEDIKRLCLSLRKNAKDERVLFHYNGHGVPIPTNSGELWVFNKNYTQYIPLSVNDLKEWLSTPVIYVFDCSNAGTILSSFFKSGSSNLESKDKGDKTKATSNTNVEITRSENKNIPITSTSSTSSHNVNNLTITETRETKKSTVDPQNVRMIMNEQSTSFLASNAAILLAACRANENLSLNPDIPADVFTSCLTTPIKMAVKWHILQNKTSLFLNDLDLVDKIPGQLSDRRTLLGELNWIFTAITDSIAWNCFPKDLFQRLFRQDLLVASLFRNFLLAERVMQFYGNHPVSIPELPRTCDHKLWLAWDYVMDVSLTHLKVYLFHLNNVKLQRQLLVQAQLLQYHTLKANSSATNKKPSSITSSKKISKLPKLKSNKIISTNPSLMGDKAALDPTLESNLEILTAEMSALCQAFFSQQLTALEARLVSTKIPPTSTGLRDLSDSLPIVLQVLLSQIHRVKALDLLGKFLDLGAIAVNQALSVGIFPYMLKLLQSPAREMRPLLVYVWAKILSVDNSCQADLIKENGHKYFITVLCDITMPIEYRTMALFCISSLLYHYPVGQEACMQENIISICLEQLTDAQIDNKSDSTLVKSFRNPNAAPPSLLTGRKRRLFRLWLVICLSCVWRRFEPARWRAVRDSALEKLKPLIIKSRFSIDVAVKNTQPSINTSYPLDPISASSNDLRNTNSTTKKAINTDGNLLNTTNLINSFNPLNPLVSLFRSTESSENDSPVTAIDSKRSIGSDDKGNYEYVSQSNMYSDGPEIRVAAVLALGNLISGSSVHSDHSVSVDHSIARDLFSDSANGLLIPIASIKGATGIAVRDGNYLVRKELVVAIQNLIHSYENHFISLTSKLLEEETKKIETSAEDAHYLTDTSSKIPSMNKAFSSSTMTLNNISGLTDSAPSLVSSSTNVYYLIWKTLLTLSADPHVDVAQSAKILISNLKRRVSLLNSAKRETSKTLEKHGSSGFLASLTKSDEKMNPQTYSTSPHSAILISNGGPASNLNLPITPTSTPISSSPTTSNAPLINVGSPDITYSFSRSRKIFDKGPSLITQDTYEELINESDSAIDITNKSNYQRVFSVFVSDCCKSFWKQVDVLNPQKEKFPQEFERAARSLKYAANNQFINEAKKIYPTRKTGTSSTFIKENTMPKFEIESSLPKFASRPTCLRFFPFHPLIAVADTANNVNMWNTDNQQMMCGFVNCSLDTKITCMEILNDFDIYPLLCVGSSDGSIRIWKNLFNPRRYVPRVSTVSPVIFTSTYSSSTPSSIQAHSNSVTGNDSETGRSDMELMDSREIVQPKIVGAWNGLTDFNPAGLKTANLKFYWDQMKNYLFVSGDAKIIRIWDLQKQLKLYDIATKSDYSLTSLTYSSQDNHLLATGYNDGTIKLFDIRIPEYNAIKTYKESNSPIMKIGFYQSNDNNLISGSLNGEIKLWNLASSSLSSFRTAKFSHPISAIDIHSLTSLVSGGLTNQTIGLYNPRGNLMSSLKAPTWFSAQKFVHTTVLVFHPYKLLLASCAENLVSLYSINPQPQTAPRK